jgi:hypothetical protein
MIREINGLENRLAAVRKIAKPDLDWARLLSGLNQAMIPNIWLYKFEPVFPKDRTRSSDPGRVPLGLELGGYALGTSGEATRNVGKFIKSLERYNDFFGYFDEIELENIRNQVIAGEEVMMFRLNCRFKPIELIAGEGKKTRKR